MTRQFDVRFPPKADIDERYYSIISSAIHLPLFTTHFRQQARSSPSFLSRSEPQDFLRPGSASNNRQSNEWNAGIALKQPACHQWDLMRLVSVIIVLLPPESAAVASSV